MVLLCFNWSKFNCALGFLKEDQNGKLKLVKKPLFEIPFSIMDIWYTQTLMWWAWGGCNYHYCTHALLPSSLEFLLSLVTMITMATLVLHFYVRRVRCINILLLVESPHVIKFSIAWNLTAYQILNCSLLSEETSHFYHCCCSWN